MKLIYLLLACTLTAAEVSAAEAKSSPSNGVVSGAAKPLIARAVAAAGGEANLLQWFTFKDRVLIGDKDTGFASKRESVMDAPRHWWLKTSEGYSERKGEPATFLVWAWTLRALTGPASTVDACPR